MTGTGVKLLSNSYSLVNESTDFEEIHLVAGGLFGVNDSFTLAPGELDTERVP
jgi:hypothetical protein